MDAKSRWRMAIAIPLPPAASTIGWLVCRHLASGIGIALGLAVLIGLFSLAALAIIEHEQTKRASLPYKAEHLLARAEARNRDRYGRAQTRRINGLPSGEQYSPDTATSLTEAMRVTRVTDPSTGSKNRSQTSGLSPEGASQVDSPTGQLASPANLNGTSIDSSPTYLPSDISIPE
jgi:hypothetical protein